MLLTGPAVLFLLGLAWLQQIDQWRDARPVLERLGQMGWLNRRLFGELGDALGDGEHAIDVLSRQLELPDRCCQQALARAIQFGGGSWPAACFGCAGDHLLIWLTTSTASVGHALLGAGVRGFDDQIGRQCSLKRRPPLPRDEYLGYAATGEVGVTGVPANAGCRNIGGHAVVAADAAKGERIGQPAAAAQKRDRMVAGQRHGDGTPQVLLTGNGLEP